MISEGWLMFLTIIITFAAIVYPFCQMGRKNEDRRWKDDDDES